jgi:hypothetical protein
MPRLQADGATAELVRLAQAHLQASRGGAPTQAEALAWLLEELHSPVARGLRREAGLLPAQAQDSLTDQMERVLSRTRLAGEYDAEDWIRARWSGGRPRS